MLQEASASRLVVNPEVLKVFILFVIVEGDKTHSPAGRQYPAFRVHCSKVLKNIFFRLLSRSEYWELSELPVPGQ